MKWISQEFYIWLQLSEIVEQFIKQEQISYYATSRKSELRRGPQSPELSISEMLC